jgi:hypothetical protein
VSHLSATLTYFTLETETTHQEQKSHYKCRASSTTGITSSKLLEKSKSYWYHLDYIYRQDKWTYKPTNSVPGQISLFNDETQAKEPISRLPPSSAQKALGIFTCPTGNMAAKVATWLRKPKRGPHPCKLVTFTHTTPGTA